MATPTHILVIRFSALGDVAMTVPVMKQLLDQHPDLELTFLSDPFMQPLFAGIPRLHFYGADTKNEFRGPAGLFRLARQLKSDIHFDAIADLHNVLRTKLLRFFITGVPTSAIDKGRREKKQLTRPVDKRLRPLKSTFQRYADVFTTLNTPITLKLPNIEKATSHSGITIGVAPFARHAPKMYPIEKMREVVEKLSKHPNVNILLFGSKAEAATLKKWESISTRVKSMAGSMSFSEELSQISRLTAMISMDSANMHLASLFAVPVVSVWGGTHPFLGFYGWGQSPSNAIQMDFPCRPSSVFGNRECPVHKDAGCMAGITPAMIYEKVKSIGGL